MGKPGVESEVQKLRREKDLLTQEVMQLRQEHLVTVQKMDTLNQQMQSAEMRQKQMISFLAKLLQNPLFLGHLKQMKEQREIASTRVRRKFFKQQLPSSSSASDMPMARQIVKYRSGFWDATASASLLPDTESGGQEFIGGCSESEDLKGKNLLSSQIDAGYPGIDYFLSLTGDVTPEEMASEDVTAGLTVNRPDSKTFAFKGKDVVNLETGDTAAGMEFLETFPEDTSQERMFPNVTAPGSDYVSEEGIWNIGLEAGESSLSPVCAVWDSLGQYNAQEMEEEEARSCSLWDLDLNTLEEDLEIDKYVGGESSLQERKDDGGQLNEDCPRDLDP